MIQAIDVCSKIFIPPTQQADLQFICREMHTALHCMDSISHDICTRFMHCSILVWFSFSADLWYAFTHILLGCFIGIGAIFPSVLDVILEDMGNSSGMSLAVYMCIISMRMHVNITCILVLYTYKSTYTRMSTCMFTYIYARTSTYTILHT